MKTLLIFSFLIIFQSCTTQSNQQDEWDKKNLREIYSNDLRVQKAFKKTQDSLQYFIDYFEKYSKDTNYYFSIKSKFTDNKNPEHMWAKPIKLTSLGFLSIIDNVPNKLQNYKYRDTVEVYLKNIEDFIIAMPDSTVIGNYLQSELEK